MKEIIEIYLYLGIDQLCIIVDGGEEFIKHQMELWAHMGCT